MTKIELAQACINKYGAEAQMLHMIEGIGELTVELCHLERGRFVEDKVAEETADCLAVLDQMDILFDVDKNQSFKVSDDNNIGSLISAMGFVQTWLGGYKGERGDKRILRDLFPEFRARLISLSQKIGDKRVEAWQKIKADRMVERLTRWK